MPILPYAPTNDTVTALMTSLEHDGETLTEGGEPYNGLAAQVYDPAKPERMHLRFRFRRGLKDGRCGRLGQGRQAGLQRRVQTKERCFPTR